MALPARLINAKVTVTRPVRGGPFGDESGTRTTVLRNRPAIREVQRRRERLDLGTQEEDTLEAVFWMEPADGALVERGDLIDWEVVVAGETLDSGEGAEVRRLGGIVGAQTQLAHFEVVAEV